MWGRRGGSGPSELVVPPWVPGVDVEAMEDTPPQVWGPDDESDGSESAGSRRVLQVSTARAEVQSLIARVDSKASLLLAFNGVALAGLWTAGQGVDLSKPVVGLAVVSGLLLVASIVVALWTVRPRLGDARSGFPLWAGLSPAEAELMLSADGESAHLVTLAKIAVSKMRAFQRAVDLTLAAVAVAVLAAAVWAVS